MSAPHQSQTELFSESHAGLSSQSRSAPDPAKPNPVFVSIKPSYLEALKALGYTESEARFLYVVATHSGFFVARQFLAFTCGHWGKRATAFWHKLHTKKHARTEYFPMHGEVYHVFSRKLYGQICRALRSGQPAAAPASSCTSKVWTSEDRLESISSLRSNNPQ